MDLNRLTQKSQQALSAAQDLATRAGHTEIDREHLLLALLEQPDGLVPRLLTGMGVDVDAIRGDVEVELERKPRTTQPGARPGQVTVTQALGQILEAAQRQAKRLSDEYVSVEHLLVSLADESRRSPAGRLLDRYGVTRDRFLAELTNVRGNQQVTTTTPEGTYEALTKYGQDLVAAARSGRLATPAGSS